jgi:hypothetical protein
MCFEDASGWFSRPTALSAHGSSLRHCPAYVHFSVLSWSERSETSRCHTRHLTLSEWTVVVVSRMGWAVVMKSTLMVTCLALWLASARLHNFSTSVWLSARTFAACQKYQYGAKKVVVLTTCCLPSICLIFSSF